MGWKNWPSWLKGGIILGAIQLFISISSLIFVYLIKFGIISNLDLGFAGVGVAFTLQLGYLIIPIIIGNTILYFIFGAIIGALIGWIYGKIKQRKKENA